MRSTERGTGEIPRSRIRQGRANLAAGLARRSAWAANKDQASCSCSIKPKNGPRQTGLEVTARNITASGIYHLKIDRYFCPHIERSLGRVNNKSQSLLAGRRQQISEV